jgi:hypothetical protein
MNARRVKRISELARDIPPARDLWPGIAAAIEADKLVSIAPAAPRRPRWMPAAGMAAALALVAIGVLIGRSFSPDTAGPLAEVRPSGSAGMMIPAALRRDAEYRKQRDELLVEVQSRLEQMPAAERDKVAASLATLRRSIAEIEAALGRDPANALLQELLVSTSQEEMRALTAVRDSGRQET